jgi:TolA-binding protein
MKQTKILFVVLFLGLFGMVGCSGYHQGRPGASGEPASQEVVSEVKRVVEENVKDPEKSNRVQALVQNIIKEVNRSAQETRGFHEQLAVLNANYDAPPEQFTKILDALNNGRMESAAKILQTRFKIKELLSREEWKNLNDAMLKSREQREQRPPSRGDTY